MDLSAGKIQNRLNQPGKVCSQSISAVGGKLLGFEPGALGGPIYHGARRADLSLPDSAAGFHVENDRVLDEFVTPDAPQIDFVFTVCDSAAGEPCPVWPGQPMTAHWSVEDHPAV